MQLDEARQSTSLFCWMVDAYVERQLQPNHSLSTISFLNLRCPKRKNGSLLSDFQNWGVAGTGRSASRGEGSGKSNV